MSKAPPSEPTPSKRFKLILQEEGTFAEHWSMRVQPNQLRFLAALSILTVALITYALVALTPLKERVVPGYDASETRAMQADSWRAADSLSTILDRQSRYLDNLRAILSGDLPVGALTVTPDLAVPGAEVASELEASPTAALDDLRERVEEEDAFAVDRPNALSESGLWMPPVEGTISSEWNPGIGHWGVDLVAPENTPVKAVGEGTVVFAGFTSGGGHTVIVQHERNRVSVYMHNSRTLVSSGDRVGQGEPIAIIGNTGDHSSGPHLHFEWWESGAAINPALRIRLQD
ncbi:MAG: M23 family metallopeptidase [Bacteroidota bacterium]|nr:M23 family metallopeptidase [Bacteroidota bacterium]